MEQGLVWLSDSPLLPVQVVDQAPMLMPGETHKYCVRATGGAIAITLAWADFPCRYTHEADGRPEAC
jgi:hypothetical protein